MIQGKIAAVSGSEHPTIVVSFPWNFKTEKAFVLYDVWVAAGRPPEGDVVIVFDVEEGSSSMYSAKIKSVA